MDDDNDALMQFIETRLKSTGQPLEDLTAAVGVASLLETLGDAVVRSFVHRARAAGCPWSDIGGVLGVSKQAAVQRFGPVPSRPEEPPPSRTYSPGDDVERLVTDPPARLGDVPRATGGPAGVYTIWVKGRLVALGHARQSAQESKPSNRRQADGVRGRLVGVRRQPTVGLQRVLDALFPEELAATGEADDQRRASALLSKMAEYRVVETDSGADAVALFDLAAQWLPANGYELP